MSDFQDMEEMLQDFLTEAGELLSDVDNKLVELERTATRRDGKRARRSRGRRAARDGRPPGGGSRGARCRRP